MLRLKLLAAAAVVSATVASPVLAGDMIPPQNDGVPHYYRGSTTYRNSYEDYRGGYRRSYNRYYPARDYPVYETRDSGFWPGDVAAGIVGGAIGTAGALATAPFRAGAYAYSSFYHENDFACQPGTHFRGQDGLWYLCQ